MNMTHHTLIAFLFLFLMSCSTTTRKVSRDEIICQDEKQQVRTDVKNGKIVYCIYNDPMLPPLRYKDEISGIMLKHHIAIEDFRTNENNKSCYCQLMEEEIGNRFGKDFIERVKQMSDSMFLSTRTDSTFEPWICDSGPVYPGSSNEMYENKMFQSRFDSLVKYPKGYQNKNKTASLDFIAAQIVVKKTGEATITGFIPLIRNKNNKRFEKYLEDQIGNILPARGWQPATILKQPVNCAITMSVDLK